jgi:hypothetical protein
MGASSDIQSEDLLNLLKVPVGRQEWVLEKVETVVAGFSGEGWFPGVRVLLSAAVTAVKGATATESEWRLQARPTLGPREVLARRGSTPKVAALDQRADGVVSLASQALTIAARIHPPGSEEFAAVGRLSDGLFDKPLQALTQQPMTSQYVDYKNLLAKVEGPSMVADFERLGLSRLQGELRVALSEFLEAYREAEMGTEAVGMPYEAVREAQRRSFTAYCDLLVGLLAATQGNPELRTWLVGPFVRQDAEYRESRKHDTRGTDIDPGTGEERGITPTPEPA